MTMSDNPHWPTSALHAADIAFAALTCEPDPLAIDCDSLGAGLGLPPGQLPLPTLRDWLADHPRDHDARHAVWRELVLRARLCGPQWVIAAVGMAMPLLVRVAREVCEGFHGDPTDVDAQVLTGFLDALRNWIDLDRDDPYSKLHDAAQRAGRDHVRLCQHPGSSHRRLSHNADRAVRSTPATTVPPPWPRSTATALPPVDLRGQSRQASWQSAGRTGECSPALPNRDWYMRDSTMATTPPGLTHRRT